MRFYKAKYKGKLQKKGYAKETVKSYIRRLEKYEQWCKQKQNYKNESETQLAFKYLKHLQKNTTNSRTINRSLQPLRLYYRLFRKHNPFAYTYIKREVQSIKHNFFSTAELAEIYDNYPQKTTAQIRNKVLLGLYVFQGIKSSEVKTINTKDLDLNGYIILLKGDNRTNKRKIGLNIKQILLLSQYIDKERIILQKENKETALILFPKGKYGFHNLLSAISSKLKKDIYGFEGLYQLRASVIYNWVKEYDVRKAQYLSGHKYISSTEKFKVEDINGLIKEIEKYFPIQ